MKQNRLEYNTSRTTYINREKCLKMKRHTMAGIEHEAVMGESRNRGPGKWGLKAKPPEAKIASKNSSYFLHFTLRCLLFTTFHSSKAKRSTVRKLLTH